MDTSQLATTPWLDALTVVVAVVAGGIASVTGFAIGSLLTPVFSLAAATNVAVAAVSVPHLIGTACRFWLLRGNVDRRVLRTFGLASAAGGLTGALLHDTLGSPWLTTVFGLLLLFAAFSEVTGLARTMRFQGPVALVAGTVSGLLGGLVGNQGGIRSAALLGSAMPRDTFVATATAIGLIVDGVRMPVYLATTGREAAALWPMMALASAGVVAGTLLGNRLLTRIPETRFRAVVAVILAGLGVTMLMRGLQG
jgi:uncharacterized protein